MPNEAIDGGVTALGGFLYQIVGVLGLAAWAHNPRTPITPQDVETLLSVVRTSELGHEIADQDALLLHEMQLTGERACAIIQFKYSQQPVPPKLKPAEYRRILERLHDGAVAAHRGGRRVTSYYLVTNRELGPRTQQMMANAVQGIADPYLPNDNVISVARHVHMIGRVLLSDCITALARFAARYGADDDETKDGIHQLTGSLLHRTTAREETWITLSDIIRAFTGAPDARPLTCKEVITRSTQDVTTFRSGLPAHEAVIQREAQRQIAEAATTRALVLVHGHGGCGKTEAFRGWAYDLTHQGDVAGACTAITPADMVQEDWAGWVVAGWANAQSVTKRRREQLEDVIGRLARANPDVAQRPPILHLGIDGLDDHRVMHPTSRQAITQIVNWFKTEDERVVETMTPPRAALVVTLRDNNKFALEWLAGYIHGTPDEEHDLVKVEISDFTKTELQEAADAAAKSGILSQTLAERIKRALWEPSIPVTSTRQSARLGTFRLGEMVVGGRDIPVGPNIGSISPYTLPINQEVVRALQHPAMWATFIRLGDAWHARTLNRDQDALHELCRQYVRRFYNKAYRRGRAAGLSEQAVLCLFHNIAIGTDQSAKHTRQQHWIDTACATHIVDSEGAGMLFSEAESWGLIRVDIGDWWWLQPLVHSFLVMAAD